MATDTAIIWRNRKTGFGNKAFKLNASPTNVTASPFGFFNKVELLAAFREQFGLWVDGFEMGKYVTKFYVHLPKSRSPGSRTVAFRTPSFLIDALVNYDQSGRVGVVGPVVFKPLPLRFKKRSGR